MLVGKLGGPVSLNQDWQLGKIGIYAHELPSVALLLLGGTAERTMESPRTL